MARCLEIHSATPDSDPGVGTPSHLLGEQFRVTLGLDMVHVPYGGSGPAIVSAVAGQTPVVFAALSAAAPQAREGKLRLLAVMSKSRAEGVKEAPTIAEAGYPDMDGDGWVGLFMPAGTPKEIIARLNAEIAKVMNTAVVKERMATQGFERLSMSPGEFAAFLQTDLTKWGKVIKTAGIRAE